jgi:hypothetical protein
VFKKVQNYDYQHPIDFDFSVLADLLNAEKYALAKEKIQVLANQIAFDKLPFEQCNYTRNIIIDNQQYWLGILNWDKGAATRIHGHPDHAFVAVIKGHLCCKNFAKDTLLELGSSEIVSGDYRYNKGIKGRMDNYIHQINAKESSVSLHFYSDNPAKGEVFDL